LIKDTYLRLAYHYLLQNDVEKYDYYLKLVKSRGNAIDEKDKQALKEANDAKPDIDLLKARFYFDGGYYSKALSQIVNKDANSLKLSRDKIELYYRLGRIYDKLNKTSEALLNYQRAINLGKTTGYYFSSNAALRIGNIYEQNKDFTKAGNYYNKVLEMKNHEYQTSIDNDAKAGLKRINQ
jgi:tetratricopeptide (TPR) repeat protein